MRVLLITALLASALTARAELPAGTSALHLTYGGLRRGYQVHVPSHRRGAMLPVVLNLHGAASDGAGQEKYSGMDAASDRHGFIVVYPDGTGRGRLLVWNAGTCCGKAAARHVDDVGFLRAVVADVARRIPIDRSRVFATGMSNGAMMTYRLAAEAPDLVAAIAPVAGSMAVAQFHPARPVPILHIHSVDDPRALYAGGLGPPFPFTSLRVMHQPVEETIRRWAAVNGCPTTPRVDRTIFGKKWTPYAANSATKLVYGPCNGAPIVLWKLTGSGHVWPGGAHDYPRILGRQTHLIDANEEIWSFFASVKPPR